MNDEYTAESGLTITTSIVIPRIRLSEPVTLPFAEHEGHFTDSILYSILKFFTCFVVMIVVAFGLALIGSQFEELRRYGGYLGFIYGTIGCFAFMLTEFLFSYFE
jgi:hypothetical protein